jgi:hypothetical protein
MSLLVEEAIVGFDYEEEEEEEEARESCLKQSVKENSVSVFCYVVV